jgi:CIC family chloride channel protein
VVIAGDILHDNIPVVSPEASLTQALESFTNHDGERLPVVSNARDRKLIGSVSKTDVILALAGSNRTGATAVQ